MHKKHNWTIQDCKNINWIAIKYAIQQVPAKDCPTLQKFLHDWLPLQGSKASAQPDGNHHCPLCGQEQDFCHFLECQHPHQMCLFLQLQWDLSILYSTAKINPHMFQLLWQGLTLFSNSTALPIKSMLTPNHSLLCSISNKVLTGIYCSMAKLPCPGLPTLTTIIQ